ncbi:Hypothetical predicted protein, partial [Pelobates cultripes]
LASPSQAHDQFPITREKERLGGMTGRETESGGQGKGGGRRETNRAAGGGERQTELKSWRLTLCVPKHLSHQKNTRERRQTSGHNFTFIANKNPKGIYGYNTFTRPCTADCYTTHGTTETPLPAKLLARPHTASAGKPPPIKLLATPHTAVTEDLL